MNRVTFELDGRFTGDAGPTVIFYRENCEERVRFVTANRQEFLLSLDAFLEILRSEKNRRIARIERNTPAR